MLSKEVEQLLSADSDMASLPLELRVAAAATDRMQFKLMGSVVMSNGSDLIAAAAAAAVFFLFSVLVSMTSLSNRSLVFDGVVV